MEEDKITLDKDSFRALSSDTRVAILKSLDRRRKMLTELSKQLSMSPSTVKEHMDHLAKAGLVVQIDDGHKWKYYELTGKGKNVLHPEETKIWIMLGISVIAMIGIFYDMLRQGAVGIQALAAKGPAPALDEASKALQGAGGTALENGGVPAAANAAGTLPVFHITGIIIFAVILGSCIAYLAISRKKLMSRI